MTEIRKSINLNLFRDRRYSFFRRDQMILRISIDTIKTRMSHGRRRNTHMYFSCASLTQSSYYFTTRGSPYDRIIDHNYSFTLEYIFEWVQFHLNPSFPHGLGRLNKSPSYIAILDQPFSIGNARCSRKTDRRRNS